MLGFHPFASVPAQCSVKVDNLLSKSQLSTRAVSRDVFAAIG